VRVDQVKRHFGDDVAVEWRSFLLRPEPTTPNQEKFVAYTQSWLRPAEAEPLATFRPWATNNPQPESSIPAQVAAKLVAAYAPQYAEAYHRRLLEAYFGENRTISDGEVLAALAVEVGLDSGQFFENLREHQAALTHQVIAEHNSAIESGVTAVPTMVLDDILPIQGAQDFESYKTWITKLRDRRLQSS